MNELKRIICNFTSWWKDGVLVRNFLLQSTQSNLQFTCNRHHPFFHSPVACKKDTDTTKLTTRLLDHCYLPNSTGPQSQCQSPKLGCPNLIYEQDDLFHPHNASGKKAWNTTVIESAGNAFSARGGSDHLSILRWAMTLGIQCIENKITMT